MCPHVNSNSASTISILSTVEANYGPLAILRVSSSQLYSKATIVEIYIPVNNAHSSDNLHPPFSGIANNINSNLSSFDAIWPLIDLFNLAIVVPNFIQAPIRRERQA